MITIIIIVIIVVVVAVVVVVVGGGGGGGGPTICEAMIRDRTAISRTPYNKRRWDLASFHSLH